MVETHLNNTEIDAYVARALAEPALGRVEEHLLICDLCRRRVEALDQCLGTPPGLPDLEDPLDVTHLTPAGLVRLHTRKLPGGGWSAEMSGTSIKRSREFDGAQLLEAKVFLGRVFYEMFPEHACGKGCTVPMRQFA
jgi:hypothetical protein